MMKKVQWDRLQTSCVWGERKDHSEARGSFEGMEERQIQKVRRKLVYQEPVRLQ